MKSSRIDNSEIENSRQGLLRVFNMHIKKNQGGMGVSLVFMLYTFNTIQIFSVSPPYINSITYKPKTTTL